MALRIDECLILQGSGTNEMYANCCCTFSCVVTNPDNKRNISDIQFDFSSTAYTISNFLLDGSAPSYPFTVDKDQQFTIEFVVCAATEINIASSLYFKLYDENGTAGVFNFDFITIDTNTTVNLTSIDFSNVPLGSSALVPISFFNSTACCYEYFLLSDCADITFNMSITSVLCKGGGQTININYTPTSLGDLNCTLTIEAGMCFMLQIPVTGKAVEPVAGGSSNAQKNKVDQTSVLPACSPRTINNQCNTAQAARAAITSRAQTITRPSGGAGRGKGFSK